MKKLWQKFVFAHIVKSHIVHKNTWADHIHVKGIIWNTMEIKGKQKLVGYQYSVKYLSCSEE